MLLPSTWPQRCRRVATSATCDRERLRREGPSACHPVSARCWSGSPPGWGLDERGPRSARASARVRVLLRLQMVSIQEIDWPVHKEDGMLDLAAIDPFLRQAANKWLGDKIDFYEEASKIERHSLAAVRLSLDGDASFGTYEEALANVRCSGWRFGAPKIRLKTMS